MIDISQLDPLRVRPAEAPQLKLAKRELDRMGLRIEDDFRGALDDHQKRQQRNEDIYNRWRGRSQKRPDLYLVPITQWQIFAKWAKEHSTLFGDDAEVVAKGVGPTDMEKTAKCGRFMTWLIQTHMKLQNKAAVFNFRKIAFGRSFAYCPYIRDTFMVPTVDGGEEEHVAWEGPGFEPLWPDDLIVPAEDVQSLQEFSFLIRKYRATPDQLLEGEGTLYQGIDANWERIVNQATKPRSRDAQEDLVKRAKDQAEGVTYDDSASAANTLVVLEWYGRWRMPKGNRDVRVENIKGRERFERELVVRYLPDLNLVVGVQDLAQMYPLKKQRRPFKEASLIKDGSYWCAGFGELLEQVEQELSLNHHLATKAGRFSVGPVVFYRPSSGFDPDTVELEPNTCIPTEDPNGVKVIELKADLTYPQIKEQTVIAYGERVTGQTDMNMGRAIDRPNAPRTARQTIALLEEGDIRASLDTAALREDWGEILEHFWDLCAMYAPKKLFFRVTEEESQGLFQTQKGGAYLSQDEMFGRYDFEIKFATSAVSRQSRKEEMLNVYQLAMANPLIATNPRALWVLLNDLFKMFGRHDFSRIVPEPPDPGMPIKPSEEWTRMNQGEEVMVNPMDNDDLHLLEHQNQLKNALTDEKPNVDAIAQLQDHMRATIAQRQQKMMMFAMADRLSQKLGQGMQGGMNPQDIHSQLGEMIGAPGSGQPGGGQPAPGVAV